MKSINSIPTSKVERASKLITTGIKIGVNYAKYYGEKIVKSDEEAKENLDEANAAELPRNSEGVLLATSSKAQLNKRKLKK